MCVCVCVQGISLMVVDSTLLLQAGLPHMLSFQISNSHRGQERVRIQLRENARMRDERRRPEIENMCKKKKETQLEQEERKRK